MITVHQNVAALCLFGFAAGLSAQTPPQFTSVQRLSSREVRLLLSVPTNLSYQIEGSSNLLQWQPIVTWRGAGINQHTDSAAPYLDLRYYRALQFTTTNDLTGDHLATTNGDVVIHPHGHAAVILGWNGKVIYVDPSTDNPDYSGLPKADLVLVTHSHSDHLNTATLDMVRGANALILAPQAVYDALTAAQKNIARVMTNGSTTNVLGLTVEAVRAYNSYHPLGTGNGYVLTLGGKRIYLSGDTGDIADMHALQNIDVAFVCMNSPYTMLTTEATNAVRAFRPPVVYPYHYRNQDGTTGNAALFKQQLGSDLGIEVRLRKWY